MAGMPGRNARPTVVAPIHKAVSSKRGTSRGMSRRKRLTGALLFLLIFVAYARTPPALQQREWRNRLKRTLFVPDPLPHLNPDLHGQFEPVPGVIAQRITYSTEFGMRIPAILYLPKPLPRQTIPALI